MISAQFFISHDHWTIQVQLFMHIIAKTILNILLKFLQWTFNKLLFV